MSSRAWHEPRTDPEAFREFHLDAGRKEGPRSSAFHHVSVDHLPRYLDELEWRFNNRENPYLFRDTLVALMSSETLTYEKLVG